jgi:uncharacterized membrane-anchored protein YhcB (DUF1043 family)
MDDVTAMVVGFLIVYLIARLINKSAGVDEPQD